jgi:thioredoxin-dependent peroxiredoxin
VLKTMLDIGSKAPDFTAETDSGETISLKDFRGKKVVLYFYPKDDTTGCTKEACDFRDNFAHLKRAGAIVFGVSPDPVKKHVKFKEKYDLPFTLVSDPDKTICGLYDVWKEKSMYGRKYMGVERSTFVIDENGKITAIWRKVKVPGHVEEVLEAL